MTAHQNAVISAVIFLKDVKTSQKRPKSHIFQTSTFCTKQAIKNSTICRLAKKQVHKHQKIHIIRKTTFITQEKALHIFACIFYRDLRIFAEILWTKDVFSAIIKKNTVCVISYQLKNKRQNNREECVI